MAPHTSRSSRDARQVHRCQEVIEPSLHIPCSRWQAAAPVCSRQAGRSDRAGFGHVKVIPTRSGATTTPAANVRVQRPGQTCRCHLEHRSPLIRRLQLDHWITGICRSTMDRGQYTRCAVAAGEIKLCVSVLSTWNRRPSGRMPRRRDNCNEALSA
jgi:hypothetical protein